MKIISPYIFIGFIASLFSFSTIVVASNYLTEQSFGSVASVPFAASSKLIAGQTSFLLGNQSPSASSTIFFVSATQIIAVPVDDFSSFSIFNVTSQLTSPSQIQCSQTFCFVVQGTKIDRIDLSDLSASTIYSSPNAAPTLFVSLCWDALVVFDDPGTSNGAWATVVDPASLTRHGPFHLPYLELSPAFLSTCLPANFSSPSTPPDTPLTGTLALSHSFNQTLAISTLSYGPMGCTQSLPSVVPGTSSSPSPSDAFGKMGPTFSPVFQSIFYTIDRSARGYDACWGLAHISPNGAVTMGSQTCGSAQSVLQVIAFDSRGGNFYAVAGPMFENSVKITQYRVADMGTSSSSVPFNTYLLQSSGNLYWFDAASGRLAIWSRDSGGALLVHSVQLPGCSPGLFYDASEQLCSACPTGTYNDQTGSSQCFSCPYGSYSFPASVTLDSCNACPFGSYLDPPLTCVPCNDTQFCPVGALAPLPASLSFENATNIVLAGSAVPLPSGYQMVPNAFLVALAVAVALLSCCTGSSFCVTLPKDDVSADRLLSRRFWCLPAASTHFLRQFFQFFFFCCATIHRRPSPGITTRKIVSGFLIFCAYVSIVAYFCYTFYDNLQGSNIATQGNFDLAPRQAEAYPSLTLEVETTLYGVSSCTASAPQSRRATATKSPRMRARTHGGGGSLLHLGSTAGSGEGGGLVQVAESDDVMMKEVVAMPVPDVAESPCSADISMQQVKLLGQSDAGCEWLDQRTCQVTYRCYKCTFTDVVSIDVQLSTTGSAMPDVVEWVARLNYYVPSQITQLSGRLVPENGTALGSDNTISLTLTPASLQNNLTTPPELFQGYVTSLQSIQQSFASPSDFVTLSGVNLLFDIALAPQTFITTHSYKNSTFYYLMELLIHMVFSYSFCRLIIVFLDEFAPRGTMIIRWFKRKYGLSQHHSADGAIPSDPSAGGGGSQPQSGGLTARQPPSNPIRAFSPRRPGYASPELSASLMSSEPSVDEEIRTNMDPELEQKLYAILANIYSEIRGNDAETQNMIESLNRDHRETMSAMSDDIHMGQGHDLV